MEGALLRMERGSEYDVIATLSPTDSVAYLEAAEGWIHIRLADGRRGWVQGSELSLWDIDLPAGERPQYHLEPGYWKIETAPGGQGERVHLTVTAPGVLQLQIQGQTSASRVLILGEQNVLAVILPDNPSRLGDLQIAAHEVQTLEASRSGFALTFGGPFFHRIVRQTPDATVIELRPQVAGVSVHMEADRQVYFLSVLGAPEPVAWRDGPDIWVDLPGAVLGATTRPEGLDLQESTEGLRFHIHSDRSYALKRAPGAVAVVLFEPGLQGKLIVIDPGHGGPDMGTVGPQGLVEKSFNLDVALRLKGLLTEGGAKVVLTRSGDSSSASAGQLTDLSETEWVRADLKSRSTLANEGQADLFLSIHANEGVPEISGTETYYSPANLNVEQSRHLAVLVQEELVQMHGLVDRGAQEESFYVLRFTEAPAALAEVAFVSVPTEEALMLSDEGRERSALALFRALERFFQPT